MAGMGVNLKARLEMVEEISAWNMKATVRWNSAAPTEDL